MWTWIHMFFFLWLKNNDNKFCHNDIKLSVNLNLTKHFGIYFGGNNEICNTQFFLYKQEIPIFYPGCQRFFLAQFLYKIMHTGYSILGISRTDLWSQCSRILVISRRDSWRMHHKKQFYLFITVIQIVPTSCSSRACIALLLCLLCQDMTAVDHNLRQPVGTFPCLHKHHSQYHNPG